MEESTEEQKKSFYGQCYTEEQVLQLLKENNINKVIFNDWIAGQTGLLIVSNGQTIFGYFKSDVDYFVTHTKKGKVPFIWD